jgi:Rps23 Pro-64 3,4-dihydroxylase Tpa1-like proline 4-hydroxylase
MASHVGSQAGSQAGSQESLQTGLPLSYCLDPDYLNQLAEQHRESYQSAVPFPHIVLDNFLPEAALNQVLGEFPKVDAIDWQSFDKGPEKKLASKSDLQLGAATRLLLYEFNSAAFLAFLEKLTGIDNLIPDPHFMGGGLHQIQPGGFLKMHVDFNKHGRFNLDRRLNLLLYLNKNWHEEYGGHLELWDKEFTNCSKKILPIFNRCVIFSTTDFSFHGHPEPLTCPEGETRKSMALYYYSNGRPASDLNPKYGEHSTVFRQRPGEAFNLESDAKPSLLRRALRKAKSVLKG